MIQLILVYPISPIYSLVFSNIYQYTYTNTSISNITCTNITGSISQLGLLYIDRYHLVATEAQFDWSFSHFSSDGRSQAWKKGSPIDACYFLLDEQHECVYIGFIIHIILHIYILHIYIYILHVYMYVYLYYYIILLWWLCITLYIIVLLFLLPTSIPFGNQMWFVMDNPSVFRGFSRQPRLIKLGTSFSQPKWVA